MRQRFARGVWAVLLATGIWPWLISPILSQVPDYLQGASPRLQLFAMPADSPAIVPMKRGLGLAGPSGLIVARAGVAPVLRYDDNINGGTPGTTIKIGGLDFAISENSRAKEGLVAGFAPAARLKWAVGRGQVIEASSSARFLRALDHDLTLRENAAGLCSGNYLGHAYWLDLCLRKTAVERDLSLSRSVQRSVQISRQFAGAGGVFELTAKRSQSKTDNYDKMFTELGATYATPRIGTLEANLTKGQRITGAHTLLSSARLALSRNIWRKPTTIFASYSYDGGATFFGTDRVDETYGIGISRQITRKMRVTMSARRSTSTIENYSGDTIGFDIAFADFRF